VAIPAAGILKVHPDSGFTCAFSLSLTSKTQILTSLTSLGVFMSSYLYLAVAIVSEVIATSALKASDGFSKFIPSVIVVIGYGIAFYCLSVVLRTMPVGIAYAIWSGLGVVLIALVGLLFYQQKLDGPALLGICLIISGVVVINVFSNSVSHQ
jgi:small multidrug resistance pump